MADKVRWGVIGATARIAGKAVIPAILECEEADLVAVASRHLKNAQEVADNLDADVKAYGDYDSLIADSDVDVVYIPLPNNLHLGWAVEAMNNGKHVLCEKPLAMNAGEAQEMVETAADNGVILSEAFMYRYHPLQEEVFRMARSGAIGQVRLVKASFSFVHGGGEDDYRRDPTMGGGALFDVGCYCVHIARSAFGVEPTAVAATQLLDPQTGIDTTTTATLEFPDAHAAQIDCSFALDYRTQYEIVGSDGTLAVRRFKIGGADTGEYTISRRGNVETRSVPLGNMYVNEIEAMSRKIRGEDVFLLSAEDGLANMRVLDAVSDAAKTGQKISLA